MEQVKKMISTGIEDFKDFRTFGCYYVDKTGLIRTLLRKWHKVTLFTRPRRFGKSLNLSMLANFFSLDGDKAIFDGLEITKEKDLCEQHMGQYPVIFLTLKEVDRPTYERAFQRIVIEINKAAEDFPFLLHSEKLSRRERENYDMLLDANMQEEMALQSLSLLSRLLEKHFGKRAIILIDEYDVPLSKAHLNGYYDQMVTLIRGLLGDALKTNKSLAFAVLTGCLRVSKESIFTGLNNLSVRSITDKRYDEYFGFTEEEVKNLLSYYGFSDRFDTVKKWYDGYRFGNAEVYCPWDVLNYCDALLDDPNEQPENYWINTSGNDAIRRLAEMAGDKDADATRDEIERLIAGETIEKEINQELTYSELYDSIDNVWSLLFMTGYLTQRGEANGEIMRLAIPNLEVRDIFVKQIRKYFKESMEADTETPKRFAGALLSGNAGEVEELFTQYLRRTISIRDPSAPDQGKEVFYHATLLTLLKLCNGLDVKSNQESGDGYADILARLEKGQTGFVIELKYARDGNLERSCREALEQIDSRRYTEKLENDGVETILKYGIACEKKRCKVMLG